MRYKYEKTQWKVICVITKFQKGRGQVVVPNFWSRMANIAARTKARVCETEIWKISAWHPKSVRPAQEEGPNSCEEETRHYLLHEELVFKYQLLFPSNSVLWKYPFYSPYHTALWFIHMSVLLDKCEVTQDRLVAWSCVLQSWKARKPSIDQWKNK